jgi:parvulin-like peptidyl-prolyl isomerase
VAKAGNVEISTDEYMERYEFTPFVSKGVKKSAEKNKEDFLYTLIAEKLWAQEAVKLGLDSSEAIKFASDQFEKMFVRDALFRKEIKDKVTVSEEELIAGFLRYTSKLKVRFLFSEDESEIKDLYSLLQAGIPFDSILFESPEYEEQIEPVEVVYGQMNEIVEDSLYKLEPGNFTPPILTPDGWYIFMLVNKYENLMDTEGGREGAFSAVKKIIEARKTNILYKQFYKDFFKERKVEADADLYKLLVKELKDLFEEKYKIKGIKEGNLLSLQADDVLRLEKKLGPEKLYSNYIKLELNPISLKYFIRMLAFDGLNIKPEEIEHLPEIIFTRNRLAIENELLAEEGIRKGYNLLPEVLDDTRIWTENYLFQALRGKFLDSVSVSDEEALNYYKKIYSEEKYPVLVNIIEVLNDTADVIEDVMREIKKGKDIRTLALHHSKRETIRKNKGETGLVPVYTLGEIGAVASGMEIGQIFGPVKLDEGFSIFKLIDKKEEQIKKPRSFESEKKDIIRELSFRKLSSKIKRYTGYLANKYGVEIDKKALKQIEVTDINSFGMRYLGFGEKITAVPLLAPNFNWIEDYIEKAEITF